MATPILFGRYLEKRGLISSDDLSRIIAIQQELKPIPAVIALEPGLVSTMFVLIQQLQRQRGLSFFEVVEELKCFDDYQIKKLEALIALSHIKIGEIIVRRGLLSREALDKALEDYNNDPEFGTRLDSADILPDSDASCCDAAGNKPAVAWL